MKLAITLDRTVSLKDLTGHPVLADMAALIDGKSERTDVDPHELAGDGHYFLHTCPAESAQAVLAS